MSISELAVLQTVRLKGRVSRAELTGQESSTALVDAGLLVDAPTVRLTDEGRTRLAELLAVERATVDRRCRGPGVRTVPGRSTRTSNH